MIKKFVILNLIFSCLNVFCAETKVKVEVEQNYVEVNTENLKYLKDILTKNGLNVQALHPVIFDYLNEYKCLKSIDFDSRSEHQCVLPNDKIALSFRDEIRIYDVNNNTIKVLSKHVDCIYPMHNIEALCHLKDNLLACVDYEGRIKIWNVDTGECTKIIFTYYRPNFLYYLGQNKLAAAADWQITVWDISSGECLKRLDTKNVIFYVHKLKESISNNQEITESLSGYSENLTKLCDHSSFNYYMLPNKKLVIQDILHWQQIKFLDIDFEKSIEYLKHTEDGCLNDICLLSNGLLACIYVKGALLILDIKSGECLNYLKSGHSLGPQTYLQALSNEKFASFGRNEQNDNYNLKIWVPIF